MRIAMISGPRTVSTAMMRAWENRLDTVVWDEPLYAHYLSVTRKAHPGAAEVLKAHAHEIDAAAITARLAGDVPDDAAIWYQKHIAQHFMPDVDRDWLDQVQAAFLIRDPARLLASLWVRYPEAGLADTGLVEQVELFDRATAARGCPPPVVDSDAVRRSPEPVLRGLCDALGVAFDEAMLAWPPGSRDSDGVWGRWWYDVVERSTGFTAPPDTPRPAFDDPQQQQVLESCMALYDRMAPHVIH